MTLEEKLKAVALDDYDGTGLLVVSLGKAIEICRQEIDEACKKQREICAEYYIGQSLEKSWGARDIILNAPSPKEDKKYYCKDCGVEMNEGEASAFTCCEVCWDKHYKNQSPKESE